ncbi:winged helix-turn-helix domain-containing protein [Hwanghaeella grinnelliae]|uniref:Winged helix-turn-helix domain-containing protein n=1 Tax=Hwanghaeella grinnelliae TaxID=2500179 RepID=A0A437QVN4_9PROT|nr:crosslink repair DNA glycosylase YcaQ family protein [Hwanghaeella grinnelliae]RVU38590.1 winged helix-turn-helix domain-containing protein [Hwanghaeella grinnelliae]
MIEPTLLEISAKQARSLVLALQGLSDAPGRRIGVDGLYDLIERMGYVQLDSVNTVARAHHMILFSRNQTYRPKHLAHLHEKDARLFENWTHDASLIPTKFFPYWRHKFEREAESLAVRFTRWHEKDFRAVVDGVVGRIRDEGPLMSRHFEADEPKKSAGWWNWHDSKIALEFLWRTGHLSVARREGFQKVYDLSEHVIPDPHFSERHDHDAFVDWACRAALQRLGTGTPGEISRFFDLITVAEAKAWCDQAGPEDAVPVLVHAQDGSKPRKAVARPDIETLLANTPDAPSRVRVLSPFDPVIRDRVRLKRLFDYDYRIEIFVPAPKRQYGYYVFPLLEGDRLIGRIDMKADKSADALTVTGLWLEPGVKTGKGRQTALEAELDRIRRFTDVGQIVWEKGYRRDPP